MPYQILPNIIFIFAILGILLIILRHLPKAVEGDREANELPVEEKLSRKGLPAIAISKINVGLKVSRKKIWNFLLEAKDLKPGSLAGYKIKKLFGPKQQTKLADITGPQPVDFRDEQHFLELIKKDPKN